MSVREDYTEEDVTASLRAVGVMPGDVIFCHVSAGRLGRPAGEATVPAVAELLCRALHQAVGPAGTVLLPTYSYSIGRGEPFDPALTPGTIGAIPEFFRQLPGAVRSADPMLAVSGRGPEATALLSDLPWTCYGEGSLYERLRERRAKICTIGLPLHWATFRHHIEELARVPFRFAKLFTGEVRRGDQSQRQTWSYFASIRQDCCAPDGVRLQEILRAGGDCRVAPLGRSEVWCIDAATYFDRGLEELQRDPWLTAKGPPRTRAELIAMEDARAGAVRPMLSFSPETGCMQVTRELTPLARDVVSAGFEGALEALAAIVPMTIHGYPSGEPCFTWVVPEKWTCREAWLERLDGTRLLDVRDSPLHVLSYSQPFEGEISREDLLPHLYTHPSLPDAIPFAYSYFVRRWGLSCSEKFKQTLTDERYRVRIDSDTSYGELRVGECVVPGKIPEGFVLCAHLDHPGQANDGLSGVAVGVEVIKRLRAMPPMRHTVRLLIVSETFGSLAWLSHLRGDVGTLKSGIFLEMLGLDNPPALQRSWEGSTCWDDLAVEAARDFEPDVWDAPFLHVVTNDERQFNAPGVRVPMLSLSRVSHGARTGRPVFPEYHSNRDDAASVHPHRLESAVTTVLGILRRWDAELTPVPLYQGEPCLTRVGAEIDFSTHPEMGAQLYDVMHAIDGRLTQSEIAARTGIEASRVADIVQRLRRARLVSLA